MIGWQKVASCLVPFVLVVPVADAASLQDMTAAALKDSAAPALGAVIVQCDGGIETAVAGVARIDGQEALGPEARFNIGSNAKSMLASLAATYVQDGTLRWRSTVGDILGDVIPHMDEQVSKATLAQLLSHRSGLAGYDTGAELSSVRVAGEDPVAQRLDFARQVLSRPPAKMVGSTFVYSNAGYIVAGAMLEKIGGASFDVLMQERFFAPLWISARFGSAIPVEAGHPWGHYARDGVQRVYTDVEPAIPTFLQPAGDVSITLDDYGKYLREHLCGMERKATRLLTPDTIQALHAAQGPDGAGMGWGQYRLGGVASSIHTGGTGTFSAFVAVQPEKDRAFATVTNTGGAAGRKAALSLLQAISAEQSDAKPVLAPQE